jgi:CheY-like chemotaxis protein/anti-sigma regulatory factor (Ser/Thr protein kinase)
MTKKFRILLVDDTPKNLHLLYEILQEGSEYMINVARNGVEALDAIKKVNFDIILLDVQMPEMDGFETCSRLKKMPLYSNVPIIFLTAQDDQESIIRALELGAVDYLKKPFCALELKVKVRNHLALKNHQDNLESLIDTRTKKLEDALTQLTKISKVKDEFLGVMSHELRTPMNGIQGFTNLLLMNETLGEQERSFVEGIDETSIRLQKTIESMFDYIFLQNEDSVCSPKLVDFKSELSFLIDFQEKAENKGLNFVVEVSEALIRLVSLDFPKFQKILSALVDNALKFTKEGRVKVNVLLAFVEEQQVLSVEVSDTGIGIEEEQYERIFEKFYQVDSSSSREFEGVGLGLAIVKELTLLLGGESVHVHSRLGEGSTFSLSLPVETKYQNKMMYNIQLAEEAKSLKVLLVEDNKTNQILARKVLQSMKHNVAIAENGLEALEVLNKDSFDLIIMDCMMPKMDGYEATREIRKIGYADLPIIALTANNLEGDREKCLSVGMNDYLSKPLITSELKVLLEKYS